MAKSFVLLPWQCSFFNTFKEVFHNPNSQVVVVRARRQIAHKSATGLMCAIYALTHSEYASFGWFSISFKQCRKQFMELKKWSAIYNLHCTLDFNNSLLIVTCKDTNSSLYFYSLGDADNVRGETLSGAFVDEAAFIGDNAFSMVFPMLDVEHGWLIALSTPWTKKGMYYELFTDKDSIVCDWVSDYNLNDYASPERIEFYRRTLKPSLFKTEILGEFLDDGESVLYGNITPCILSEPPVYSNEPVVIGVDTSSGQNDYCAITAFFLKDGIAYEHSTLRFCNADVTHRINQFASFIAQFKPSSIKSIMWETNGGGSDLLQLVKKQLPAQYSSKFVADFWSFSTKSAAVSNSVLWFSTATIRLHSSILIDECSKYTEFVDKSGKVSYGNAHQEDRDCHDDCWCSALHALSALRTATYKGTYTLG